MQAAGGEGYAAPTGIRDAAAGLKALLLLFSGLEPRSWSGRSMSGAGGKQGVSPYPAALGLARVEREV